MADRVYPAAKPNPPPAAAANGTTTTTGSGAPPPSFPAPKPQMYQRPIYRPQQAPSKRRRRGRSCRCSFCCCFCWTLLLLLLAALVAAAAGGAFYLLYKPQRPAFTVSSVRLASLNLTSSPTSPSSLTDAVTLTVTARNPNKKMVYLYDDLTISVATAANAVPMGSATVPGFAHAAGNTTVVTATVSADAVTVDPTGASSDIKKSGSFAVVVDADTSAGVRVGSLKTKKIGIQVHCEGIKVTAPPAPAAVTSKKVVKGKNSTELAPAPAPAADDAGTAATTATVSTAAHSCKVRIRVKIWKWTF